MDKKKILIIDDEKDFCKLIKKNLELTGNFDVDIALDGKNGLRLAKKAQPHLILLDILMPHMDGFEVLRRLKKSQNTRPIPVIMLSAKGDESFKIKAAQLYDEAYLTKPVSTLELNAKIDKVLKRRFGE